MSPMADRTLETERLRLRPYRAGDLERVAALYADGEITAFTKLGRRTRAETEAILEGYLDDWRARGFGMRAVLRKDDGAFLGECGLFVLERTGEAALRYALFKPHWGRGYTTEAVRATLADAFERVGLDQVVSIVQTGNAASHRVMENAGLRPLRRASEGEAELVTYALARDEWERGG